MLLPVELVCQFNPSNSYYLESHVIEWYLQTRAEIVTCIDAYIYNGEFLNLFCFLCYYCFTFQDGPSGSQFGILSCIFVELIHNWGNLNKPYTALVMLLLLLLTLFVIGLLPIIDNYAHLFGFVYGFLLSFSIMPHVSLNISERRKKMVAVFVCFFGSIVTLLVLVLLFYVVPIYECSYCQYFSCIPFTNNFCDTMEVKIRRTEGS